MMKNRVWMHDRIFRLYKHALAYVRRFDAQPDMKWTHTPLDPMGGYDCLFAGIDIKFEGLIVFQLDGRFFGEESCACCGEINKETLGVYQRMEDAADRIVKCLNEGEVDVSLRA
jgi:hypothetical protein